MEKTQITAAIGREKERYRGCPSTVATDGHVLGVAAELADVVLNPLKSFQLVFQAVVQAATLLHLSSCEESVGADTIAKGDDHHVHIRSFNQAGTIKIRIRVRVEPTALDEEKNWEFRSGRRIARRVHVEKQAIFRIRRGVGVPSGPETDGAVLLALDSDD